MSSPVCSLTLVFRDDLTIRDMGDTVSHVRNCDAFNHLDGDPAERYHPSPDESFRYRYGHMEYAFSCHSEAQCDVLERLIAEDCGHALETLTRTVTVSEEHAVDLPE